MLRRRGFSAELSFGAFENDRLISFTFNGIGIYNDRKTAYDTGTGTLREYRGQGLAGQIFQHSLPYLREAGIQQYLLEVLKHNSPAVSVYRKQGFEVTREFSYFSVETQQITTDYHSALNTLTIIPANPVEIINYQMWFDFYPSWQNSFEAIALQPKDFICKVALYKNSPVGYCVFEPHSGDITQIAVSPSYRRQGIAGALLAEVLKENQSATVKLINADNQHPSIGLWALKKGINKKGEQFEMILSL